MSNNTSIDEAEPEKQHQEAEASTAGQNTGLSEGKNTSINKGHLSNDTFTFSDQQGKGKVGGLASKNTLYTKDIQ